jgi:hypothetical protein
MRETNKYKLLKLKYYSYIVDNITELFINHNRKVWNIFNNKDKNLDGEILFELNGMHSAAIASSYLANVLSEKYQSKIIGFYLTKPDWKSFFGLLLRTPERVFSSFGMSKVLYTKLSRRQKKESMTLFTEVYSSLKTKRDIENITIDGVLIGDLIYDSYLRSMSKPTIDIEDKDFVCSLKNSLDIYVFWKNYFHMHKVRAINVSHCVYNLAIPLRIAISKDIPAFQGSAAYVYRLSKKNIFAYSEFAGYKKAFSKLSVDIQANGLEQAKQRIELRFKGKVGVDMRYSSKSAYGQHKQERLLKESPRIKIFIALHCFFDSPHSYGYNLFPDFFEWIDFLGKISLETDYDWYMKTHPDYLPGNIPIINGFLKKYPKFVLLSSHSSHHQIIEEGIDVALTTYGTIGFEYAALGVPVINASLNNPHIAYNFNLHPKSVEEYSEMLHNLDKIDLKIDKNEVYEYYFMRHLYRDNNWLFDNHEQMEKDLGGYSEQFTSKIYKYWMQKFTLAKHDEKIAVLNSFIDSEDFVLERKHFKEN